MPLDRLSTVAIMRQIRLTGVGQVADRRHVIVCLTATETGLRLSVVTVRLRQVVIAPCTTVLGSQIAPPRPASRVVNS